MKFPLERENSDITRRFRPVLLVGMLAVVSLIVVSCRQGPTDSRTKSVQKKLQVQSPAFKKDQPVPEKYTCTGEDLSPPLSVSGIPRETERLAVILRDPDAPGGTFYHWFLWNLPVDHNSLRSNLPLKPKLTGLNGTRQGQNDFGEIGYRGPCPPPGSTHRYELVVYALKESLNVKAGAPKETILNSLTEEKIAATGLTTGTFGR